jgi:hypothetical protein
VIARCQTYGIRRSKSRTQINADASPADGHRNQPVGTFPRQINGNSQRRLPRLRRPVPDRDIAITQRADSLVRGIGTHWLPEAIEQRKQDPEVVVGGVMPSEQIRVIRVFGFKSALGLAVAGPPRSGCQTRRTDLRRAEAKGFRRRDDARGKGSDVRPEQRRPTLNPETSLPVVQALRPVEARNNPHVSRSGPTRACPTTS